MKAFLYGDVNGEGGVAGRSLIIFSDDEKAADHMAAGQKKQGSVDVVEGTVIAATSYYGVDLRAEYPSEPTATHNGNPAPVCPKCHHAYPSGDEHKCEEK